MRVSLLNTYVAQAICSPACKYHAGMILIPQYSDRLIATDCPAILGDAISQYHIPGLNLFCIFMNMEETYEDGMVLSRTAANRFKYISNISMYLHASRDDIPTIHSTILPHSVPWWQNHFDGVVSSIEGIGNGKVKLVVVFHCLPVNGDKFTTLHGQKGVVTILDDYRMPSINGKTADIVIASSSIIKRQTTSQLLEAASNMHCVTHMEVKSCVSCTESLQ
jgi:hypothetical protein